MNQAAISLWIAIFVQGVVVALFVVLHFIVEPRKEKIKWKREQLTKFYAPLYATLNAQGDFWIRLQEMSGQERPDKLIFATRGDGPNYQDRDHLENFIYEHSGYANLDLLAAWTRHVSAPDRCVSDADEKAFCKAIVAGYNQLRKELGLDYNEQELTTGIPEIYSYLRD